MSDFRQALLEDPTSPLVSRRLEGPGGRTGLDDPLDSLGVEGPVSDGMCTGPLDIVRDVMLLELKDEPGMVSAVSRLRVLESHEELLGRIAKPQECLAHRLETVANHLGLSMVWILLLLACPSALAFMVSDQIDLGAVDEDLVFGGLHGEDLPDVLVGHGVEVGLELEKTVPVPDPQGHFAAVVGMYR